MSKNKKILRIHSNLCQLRILKNRVERISRKIAEDNDCSKDVKNNIRQIKEESIPKLEKYEEHLNTMGDIE